MPEKCCHILKENEDKKLKKYELNLYYMKIEDKFRRRIWSEKCGRGDIRNVGDFLNLT